MAGNRRFTPHSSRGGRGIRRQRNPRPSSTPGDLESAGATASSGRQLPTSVAGRIRTNLGLTHRALIFFAVIAVLALSYVNSLRTYLAQQGSIAAAQQQVSDRSQRVAQLEEQLNRWNDPAYVKSQARTRLGWVMPGEVGYRVIGPDGTALSGDQEVTGLDREGVTDLSPRWWERLGGSISAADDPPPVPR